MPNKNENKIMCLQIIFSYPISILKDLSFIFSPIFQIIYFYMCLKIENKYYLILYT